MPAEPIDPGFKPVLQEGMRDLAVRAAQNALHRALAAKGLPHNNLRNGAYGSLTKNDVNRFENAFGIRPVQGRNIGPETWAKLTPYLSRTDKIYLARRRIQVTNLNRKERKRQQAAAAKLRDPRARLERVCEVMWANRGHLYYSWLRPFIYNIAAARTYDCSGTVSVIYYNAGLPDPNGLGHNGFGYTGTLWPRGTFTWKPRPGDLAFYGYDRRGPYPSHVAIVISAALAVKLANGTEWEDDIDRNGLNVLSFGSDPMRVARLRYRSDYRGCRVYV